MNKFLTPLGAALLGLLIAVGPAIMKYNKEVKIARKELRAEMEKEIKKELTIENRLTALETTQEVHKGDIYDNKNDITSLRSRHAEEGEK